MSGAFYRAVDVGKHHSSPAARTVAIAFVVYPDTHSRLHRDEDCIIHPGRYAELPVSCVEELAIAKLEVEATARDILVNPCRSDRNIADVGQIGPVDDEVSLVRHDLRAVAQGPRLVHNARAAKQRQGTSQGARTE